MSLDTVDNQRSEVVDFNLLFASPVLMGCITHMTNKRRQEMALDLSMDVSYGRSV